MSSVAAPLSRTGSFVAAATGTSLPPAADLDERPWRRSHNAGADRAVDEGAGAGDRSTSSSSRGTPAAAAGAAAAAPSGPLAAAAEQLQRLVSVRLKELQLLSGAPLVKPRRTDAQLARMLLADDEQPVWEAIGARASPYLDLPALPEALPRDLYCQRDLLMVLAGLLKEPAAAVSTETVRGLRSGGHAALPRSLALVTRLPALQELQAPSLDWLRTFFADLRPQQRHVGLDDRQHPWFGDLKLATGRTLLKDDGAGAMCRAFARHGVPQGVRPALWERALGLAPLTQQDVSHFCDLCESARAQPLLIDLCCQDDVRSVQDSEHFFLFEEHVRAIMLAFSRDPDVRRDCSVPPAPTAAFSATSAAWAPHMGRQSDLGRDASTALPYPPAGVLPFQGLALYAAPMCYLFENPAAVYRLFRTMYCRYWCKLHSLSDAPLPSPALPLLLRTFEQLLLEVDPEVTVHMQQHIGCPAAAVALPWLCASFVGYLPVQEVLLLWDRVIGLDSLLPLAVLAVAVVCFRRQVVLSCHSTDELLEVMGDLSQLQTVPLLQAVLFQG